MITELEAMVEEGVAESLRIFWGRIGILEGLEDLREILELMEESVAGEGACRGDVEPELG